VLSCWLLPNNVNHIVGGYAALADQILQHSIRDVEDLRTEPLRLVGFLLSPAAVTYEYQD
jgi:hypothetical protein